MASEARKLDSIKDVISSAQKESTAADKMDFYDKWAQNYDTDVAILEYRAPGLAADSVAASFTGDRGAALVLDVACGTGLAAIQMKKHGFEHFVGVDGSKGMLELAKNTGLYEDVRHCMLGDDELPVQWGSFDVVVIVGSLLLGHVPVRVTKELCKATKPGEDRFIGLLAPPSPYSFQTPPALKKRVLLEKNLTVHYNLSPLGGLVCITTRNCQDNAEYTASLKQQLKLMEEEGLWSCVNVTEVKKFQRSVSEHEEAYVSGSVCLFRVSDVAQ
ncbi:hypothetical protein NHX12_009622 [Muraenolepis orangiensis]|uniref:Methyltransferase domain-containing protein n=1 Tax=Muraenolepis orangiensis TaxID=630683 RepID=A0A9Q0DJP9_9TELE|nr:hypothetical protein NHX12_009622 [Muraenolepis orangiensis]